MNDDYPIYDVYETAADGTVSHKLFSIFLIMVQLQRRIYKVKLDIGLD